MADPIQGAAEKISGLLNPQGDTQVPETKAEPSESIAESMSIGDTGLSASTKKGKTKRRLIFENFIVFPKK